MEEVVKMKKLNILIGVVLLLLVLIGVGFSFEITPVGNNKNTNNGDIKGQYYYIYYDNIKKMTYYASYKSNDLNDVKKQQLLPKGGIYTNSKQTAESYAKAGINTNKEHNAIISGNLKGIPPEHSKLVLSTEGSNNKFLGHAVENIKELDNQIKILTDKSNKQTLNNNDKNKLKNLKTQKSNYELGISQRSNEEIITQALQDGVSVSDIIATKQGLNKDKCDSWYCSFLFDSSASLYDVTKNASQNIADGLIAKNGDLFKKESFLDYFKKDSTDKSQAITNFNAKLKTKELGSIKDYKSLDLSKNADCQTDMSSSACSKAIAAVKCKPKDSGCTQAKEIYNIKKKSYEDNKAVELNMWGEMMNLLTYKGDASANKAAAFIFGNKGSSFKLPSFLTDSMESTICKDKIEGYLDKDFASKNPNNGIGRITKFTNTGDLSNPNIKIKYDLRASHTGLTPDNKINIHYSYYLDVGSTGQFMVSVNFINSKGNIEKKWLFEKPKKLSSKMKNTGFYDLNISNGIKLNTLKLKVRVKNGGSDIITPIEIPILPASADAYTGLGNSAGNQAAKNDVGSSSPTMPAPESWD